jgi:myo-inositol 2-dehydrogenase/D-chiro-inositol 1-dehydrogenase
MLEIALIGAGRIGQIHGRNIAAHPGAKLRWVTDVNADAAGKLASQLGAQSGTDAKKAIEDPAVKAVAICSSTDTHAEMIELAAKAGRRSSARSRSISRWSGSINVSRPCVRPASP